MLKFLVRKFARGVAQLLRSGEVTPEEAARMLDDLAKELE